MKKKSLCSTSQSNLNQGTIKVTLQTLFSICVYFFAFLFSTNAGTSMCSNILKSKGYFFSSSEKLSV